MVRITKEEFPLYRIKDRLERDFDVSFKYHERLGSEWLTAKTKKGFVTIGYHDLEDTGETVLRFGYDEDFYMENKILYVDEDLDIEMTKYFKERNEIKLF